MALSNRDRINRMFEVIAPALDDFISSVIGQGDPALGAAWPKLVQNKDSKNGAPSTKTYEPLDPQVQLRMLTEGNASIAQVASAFAVTEAHVRRRVRLGALPDAALDALKAGAITIGQALAASSRLTVPEAASATSAAAKAPRFSPRSVTICGATAHPAVRSRTSGSTLASVGSTTRRSGWRAARRATT